MTQRKPIPITLLSGFLGAGKTTLVKAVLKNKAGLKCAVLVNDMAAVNVDSEIITKTKSLKKDDKLVHFENGCICCDLNDELLDQIVALADSGDYDNIIIEVTGVADPQGVVDSLSGPEAAIRADVRKAARLDTCVTVVDSSMFFRHLNSTKRLKDTELAAGATEADETEELTSHLLVNQVDFADVILLNKTDLLDAADLKTVKATLQQFNPRARVIECAYSKVDVKDVLSTNLYASRDAEAQARPYTGPKEESDDEGTLEHAVTSFVYKARMPFHPARLHAFASRYFQLYEQDNRQDIAQSASQRAVDELHRAAAHASAAAEGLPQRGNAAQVAAKMAAEAAGHAGALAAAIATLPPAAPPEPPAPLPAPPPPQASAEKRVKEVGKILRSKGFFWMAGPLRRDHSAEWSSAGDILQIGSGGPWFAALPVSIWPKDEVKLQRILKDCVPGVGDRRQELVFIGLGLKEDAIRSALDACLCTYIELCPDDDPCALNTTAPCPELHPSVDPFVPWIPASEFFNEEGDEDEENGPQGRKEEEDVEGSDMEVDGEDDDKEEEEDLGKGQEQATGVHVHDGHGHAHPHSHAGPPGGSPPGMVTADAFFSSYAEAAAAILGETDDSDDEDDSEEEEVEAMPGPVKGPVASLKRARQPAEKAHPAPMNGASDPTPGSASIKRAKVHAAENGSAPEKSGKDTKKEKANGKASAKRKELDKGEPGVEAGENGKKEKPGKEGQNGAKAAAKKHAPKGNGKTDNNGKNGKGSGKASGEQAERNGKQGNVGDMRSGRRARGAKAR